MDKNAFAANKISMLPLNFKIKHANRFRNRVAPFKRNAFPVGA